MTYSLADLRKLVALTAFLTEKALILAGTPLFEEKPPDLASVTQKRSQIERLCRELNEQIVAYLAFPARPPSDARIALLMKAFGIGLCEIGRHADSLAEATVAWSRPDEKVLDALHSAYEASAILVAQAIGACAGQADIDLEETARNLRNNRLHLAQCEALLPKEDAPPFCVDAVRQIARHAGQLAEEAASHLELSSSLTSIGRSGGQGEIPPAHWEN